jgi:hypothetical protein
MRKRPILTPGFLFWCLSAGALAAGFLFPLSALPKASFCWFYDLTHLPCPGCGLTRAFFCISQGRWAEAWWFNPFSFFWYALALYGFFRPLLLYKIPALSVPIEGLLKSKFFFPSVAACMFLVWAFRIGRAFL